MHPACPNKEQNLQNCLLRRTQFWVRKTFSKPASLKRASLVRSWVSLADQRGIEPPPAVCQRHKSAAIPTAPRGRLMQSQSVQSPFTKHNMMCVYTARITERSRLELNHMTRQFPCADFSAFHTEITSIIWHPLQSFSSASQPHRPLWISFEWRFSSGRLTIQQSRSVRVTPCTGHPDRTGSHGRVHDQPLVWSPHLSSWRRVRSLPLAL